LAVHQGQQDRAEIALQGGSALQLAQHLFRDRRSRAPPHTRIAVAVAFIANVSDAADLPSGPASASSRPAALPELIGAAR